MTCFSADQLRIVRTCAEQCAKDVAWPNEIAVYELVKSQHAGAFSQELLDILHFCAEEVEHQLEGAVPVYNFVNAWNHALVRKNAGARLDLDLLHELAELTEPEANKGGRYRRVTVKFGGVVGGSKPEDIPKDMEFFAIYLDAYQDGLREDDRRRPITPHTLYVMFQKVHPRANGNGREGKVIYNWTCDTLAKPTFPAEPEEFKRVPRTD
jgi:hypothetical protein